MRGDGGVSPRRIAPAVLVIAANRMRTQHRERTLQLSQLLAGHREKAQKDFGLIGHRSALVGKGDTVSDAAPFQNSPRHVNDQPCQPIIRRIAHELFG